MCIPLTPAAANIEVRAPQCVAIEMDLQGLNRLAADEVHRRTEGVTTEQQRGGSLADLKFTDTSHTDAVKVNGTVVGSRHWHAIDIDRNEVAAHATEHETSLTTA